MDKNIDYKKDLDEKLEELKKIEGFPIGPDEDILSLLEPHIIQLAQIPISKILLRNTGHFMMRELLE